MSSAFREKWEQAAQELQSQRETEKATWSDMDNAALARYAVGAATTLEKARIEAALAVHPHLRDLLEIIQETLADSPSDNASVPACENAVESGADSKATPSSKLEVGQGTFSATVWPVTASTPLSSAGKRNAARPIPRGFNALPIFTLLFTTGVFLLCAVVCTGVVMVSPYESAELKKMRQDFQNAQQELEELKRSIRNKETLMAQKLEFERKEKLMWDKFVEEQRIQQQVWDYQREIDLKNAVAANDTIAAAKLEAERRRKQDETDRQTKERLAEKERNEAVVKNEIAALKAQLDAASLNAQKATLVVSQPPPPSQYPPWHYRNIWGW